MSSPCACAHHGGIHHYAPNPNCKVHGHQWRTGPCALCGDLGRVFEGSGNALPYCCECIGTGAFRAMEHWVKSGYWPTDDLLRPEFLFRDAS